MAALTARQEAGRRYYAKNRERILARQKRKIETDPEHKRKARKATADWTRVNAKYIREQRFHKLYGLTAHELAALDTRRSLGCELCGRQAALAVDHDHETGRVRGLLCVVCNRALGCLGDTAASIRKVLQYLEGGA